MSDDRFTEERKEFELAAQQARRARAAVPTLLPCRRHIERPPVTPEEIDAFADALKGDE